MWTIRTVKRKGQSNLCNWKDNN